MPGMCMSSKTTSKRRGIGLQFLQGLLGAGGAGRMDAPGLHLVFQNPRLGVVVVHDEDAQVGQVRLFAGNLDTASCFSSRTVNRKSIPGCHAGETDLAPIIQSTAWK